MIDRLNMIEKRYNEIQEELIKPEVLGNINKTRELMKNKFLPIKDKEKKLK